MENKECFNCKNSGICLFFNEFQSLIQNNINRFFKQAVNSGTLVKLMKTPALYCDNFINIENESKSINK